MFFDVVFSFGLVVYYLLLDALNLAIRPLLPVAWLFVRSSPGFVLVASETLLFGAMATVTAVLVAVAGAVLFRATDGLITFGSIFLFADGLASSASFLLGAEALYPAPRTFVGVLGLQLTVLPVMLRTFADLPPTVITPLMYAAGSLAAAVTSRRLWEAELFAGPILLLLVSGGLMLRAVTPPSLLRTLRRTIGKILIAVGVACSSVWQLVVRVWPSVRDFVLFVWHLLNYHPVALFLQRWVLKPGWRVASPLVLPAANAVLAVTLFRAVLAGSLRDHPLLLFAQLFCALSATLCTAVLSMHAFWRLTELQSFDPLKSDFVCRLLFEISRVLSAPFLVLRWVVLRLSEGRVARLVYRILCGLVDFAARNPLPSLVLAFFGNGMVLLLAYFTPVGPFVTFVFGWCWSVLVSVLRSVAMQFGAIHSGALADSTSSVGAVVCIMLSQTMIMFLVRRILDSQWPREAAAYGFPQDPNERAMLAEGMRDPRQCGRCAFGPVDYDGCAMLTSHHNERRGGAVISNACPRCEWFVARLDFWPYFTVERQASRGAGAAVRNRAFAEVVVAVRAASKACVIPFIVLRLFSFFPLVGVVLAIGYIVPWAYENLRTFAAMYDNDAYSGVAYPSRNLGGNNDNRNNNNDGDCGRRAEPVQNVTVAEALEAIESAAPAKCFLPADSSCSLCLEDFTPHAVAAAVQGAAALRALVPPVVALPCGHPLHLECAHQMFAVAQGARQLRCPLCREPISMGGSVSSRLFN
jgi:hypothetical protein